MINTRGSEVIQKLFYNELKREINDVAYNKILKSRLGYVSHKRRYRFIHTNIMERWINWANIRYNQKL